MPTSILRQEYRKLFTLCRALEAFIEDLGPCQDKDLIAAVAADYRSEIAAIEREIVLIENERTREFLKDHIEVIHYTK